jgi:predicted RNA-binding Zn ribbon-like protein
LHFAPDTEDTLEFMVALVNTGADASRSGSEGLASVHELMTLLDTYQYSGRRDRTLLEVEDVRDTRTRIRAIWDLDRDEAVEEVNRMLTEASALPYLVRHDDYDWHLHATDPGAPLSERIRVEVALALVDVIRSNEWQRMRVCAADDCEGVLVDLSRNGSKRFCSIRCGNRMNQIAHRERQEA